MRLAEKPGFSIVGVLIGSRLVDVTEAPIEAFSTRINTFLLSMDAMPIHARPETYLRNCFLDAGNRVLTLY